MEKLVIEGGRPLEGTIKISGAKNAALPMLAATLLTDGVFTFTNLPRLRDVKTFLHLLKDLGATVDFESYDKEDAPVSVDTASLNSHEASYDLVRTMRASILVLGPLLSRTGKARVSLPGGCAIGERPVDLHLKALKSMGAKLTLKEGYVEAEAKRLKGATIYFDVPTVTGTENIMMAAVTAKGTTILKNSAREPEVEALGNMLNAMGARITGLGTATIKIEGVDSLNAVTYEVIPDRIEAGTFLMAVGAAGGSLKLEQADPSHLESVLLKLKHSGLKIESGKDWLYVEQRGRLKSVDVTTMAYPGFPTDLQAQMMAIMATASGLSVISERIFENRFMHVAELKRMGANIKIKGPAAVVQGVKKLLGAPVMATDLRASASLVLAGLGAEGITEIHRIYHLDRGYQSIEKKLAGVGALIERQDADMPY